MGSIINDQNNPTFISYLKAQRVAYNQSKRLHYFDLVSVCIAISVPLIGLIKKEALEWIGVGGILWTIIYLIAEVYRRKKTELGAKIQERFDTELYDLEWNEILCNTKPNNDVIYDLARQYGENDLEDWYPKEIGDSLPIELTILLCQRTNFSWDITLRKWFVWILISSLILYYGFYIISFIVIDLGWFSSLNLLSPTMSFLIYVILNLTSFNKYIRTKSLALNNIDQMFELYSKNKTMPTMVKLRQIQDLIYKERLVPEKVPNWLYNMSKELNETKSGEIIKEIKSKL